MENITFYEQINLFLENKGQGNPRLAYVARVLGSYETQLGFQRAMKDKFFALKLRFGMNLTSSGSHSKPLFFNYIKPYMVYFKGQRKSKGKTQDSLEIVNQRVSFLQNIFKSIFF